MKVFFTPDLGPNKIRIRVRTVANIRTYTDWVRCSAVLLGPYYYYCT